MVIVKIEITNENDPTGLAQRYTCEQVVERAMIERRVDDGREYSVLVFGDAPEHAEIPDRPFDGWSLIANEYTPCPVPVVRRGRKERA